MRYELLNYGEIITEDVEYYNGEWISRSTKARVGTVHVEGDVPMRRPIKAVSTWIMDRLPTEDDGDCDNEVVVADSDGDLFLRKWDDVSSGERWIGKVEPLSGGLMGVITGKSETMGGCKSAVRDFQRDYIDKLEGKDAVLWGCWSEDQKNDIRKEWESTELPQPLPVLNDEEFKEIMDRF